MAESTIRRDEPMSHASFQIAYDGPAMSGHSMDVQQLGPALLSVGDLCREASRVINGEGAAEINVRVRANFEEKCFDITFDLIQWYQEVKDLIKTDDAADAKALLEWIGLITSVSGLGGLLAFLKWKRGRPIKKVQQIISTDKETTYNITIEGDGNTVEISSQVRVLPPNSSLRRPLTRSTVERSLYRTSSANWCPTRLFAFVSSASSFLRLEERGLLSMIAK